MQKDMSTFKEQDYNRPNSQKNKMHILAIVDHKNKYFTIRAEHDAYGKDSLGSYYAGVRAQMHRLANREVYMQDFPYVNTARYLYENIDTCKQYELMEFDCDNLNDESRRAGRDTVRDSMKELRKQYKANGYKDMTTYNNSAYNNFNSKVKTKLESEVA